jgi:hypothetical protein
MAVSAVTTVFIVHERNLPAKKTAIRFGIAVLFFQV